MLRLIRKRPLAVVLCCWMLVLVTMGVVRYLRLDYVHIPDAEDVVNATWQQPVEYMYDVATGQTYDPSMIPFGREAFYGETFGNEVYVTDILGAFDGALTLDAILEAILRLGGKGTDNLIVRAAQTVTVGGRTIQRGEPLETGLDVAEGTLVPLGFKLKVHDGKLKAGIGCIACHAIYDKPTGKIIEGVPNRDLNVGLMLALASNSASFFTHTGIQQIQQFVSERSIGVVRTDGVTDFLPDPDRLEQAVDEALLSWPRGAVDTMLDQVNDPVQIPDTFTKGDHPYSWNGLAPTGPLHGLVFLSSIPNSQNMDPLGQSRLSSKLYQLDPELYMGTMLQKSANPKFRYTMEKGTSPLAFFDTVDPTPGTSGTNEVVPTPNSEQSSFVSMVGQLATKPNAPLLAHSLGMALYQNALVPPASRDVADGATVELGRQVFRRAQCISCHAGPYGTNHQIIPLETIGTEPSRALATRVLDGNWGPNLLQEGTVLRSVKQPTVSEAPNEKDDLAGVQVYPDQSRASIDEQHASTAHTKQQMRLIRSQQQAADGQTQGGYKVPSLFGLYWSAPYLHDGGVAIGPRGELGVGDSLASSATLADPFNSLRALLDEQERGRLVVRHRNDPRSVAMHITGAGHTFWVDEAHGYTKAEQEALIHYLLKWNDATGGYSDK